MLKITPAAEPLPRQAEIAPGFGGDGSEQRARVEPVTVDPDLQHPAEGEQRPVSGEALTHSAEPASVPQGEQDPVPQDEQAGMLARLKASPLVRRITGYSAGSLIAVVTSELCFAAAWGVLHTTNEIANLLGFLGGAVPNYILNRKWAWKDRDGRSRRSEIIWYFSVAIVTYLLSTVITGWAESGTRSLAHSHDLRVVLVAASYLAVSGVMFILKFIVYEKVVFKMKKAKA